MPLVLDANPISLILSLIQHRRGISIEVMNGSLSCGGKTKEDKPLMQYRVTYSGVIGSVITVGN